MSYLSVWGHSPEDVLQEKIVLFVHTVHFLVCMIGMLLFEESSQVWIAEDSSLQKLDMSQGKQYILTESLIAKSWLFGSMLSALMLKSRPLSLVIRQLIY